MLLFSSLEVLNASIPLFVIILLFLVLSLIVLGIFFFRTFAKNPKHNNSDFGQSLQELKVREKLNQDIENFENEVAMVKKIIKSK